MSAKKYRKKPVVIETIQWRGNNYREIVEFTRGHCQLLDSDRLLLKTIQEEDAVAILNDWIIPDGKPGRFYPCQEDVFRRTYEAVDETI